MSTSLQKQIYYSDKYCDDEFEYRHVHVPKEIAKLVPKNKLMSESEWRNIGIQQSEGWVHYMTHNPERHVILFKRPRPDPVPTARPPPMSQAEVLRANN